MLRSLPHSFNTLTTALETRSDDEQVLNLINSKRSSGARGEPVLKASIKKQKITCHFCHKQGHKQKDCRVIADQAAGSQSKYYRAQGKKRHTPKPKAVCEEARSRLRTSGCRIFKGEKVIGSATSSGGFYYLAVAHETLASKESSCQHT